ncbi:hypothetical protein L208DRAFT_1291921, partial [Tricholoma matsutake]
LWEEQSALGKNKWAPFASQEECDLAEWLMKSVGQNSIDEFLKLPITRECSSLSFHNTYLFLKKVDQLLTSSSWECDVITVDGGHVGEGSKMMCEELELWHCNPVECIQELIGNPALNGHIAYTPVQHFTNKDGANHVINEGWIADWWWKTQVSACYGNCGIS